MKDPSKVRAGRLGGRACARRHGKRWFAKLSRKRRTFGGGRKPNKRPVSPETTAV